MPIHLDAIFSQSSPIENQTVIQILSNQLYTAVTIAFVFVLLVLLFFPLKAGSCGRYFRLFVYSGILCAVALSMHDDILVKNTEKRFRQDAVFTTDQTNSVPIEPRKGGNPPEIPEEHKDDEIEAIIKSLEEPAD